MRYHLLAASALCLLSPAALAKSLQCNSMQTLCIISDSSELTIGDRVGVFNSDGQLVATAEVSRMRGDRRSLAIAHRTGRIGRDDRIALLDTSAIDGAAPVEYQKYREPAKYEIGTNLAYSTITLGDSLPGYEASLYGQMRQWGGWQFTGRLVVDAVSGKTSIADGSADKVPLTMHGFGLLGGVGYEWFRSQPLSVRVEAAVGAMKVSALVDGSAEPVNDGTADVHVKNGTAPMARWSMGGVYQMGDHWHAHLDLAESIVYQAFSNMISIGLSRDLN